MFQFHQPNPRAFHFSPLSNIKARVLHLAGWHLAPISAPTALPEQVQHRAAVLLCCPLSLNIKVFVSGSLPGQEQLLHFQANVPLICSTHLLHAFRFGFPSLSGPTGTKWVVAGDGGLLAVLLRPQRHTDEVREKDCLCREEHLGILGSALHRPPAAQQLSGLQKVFWVPS